MATVEMDALLEHRQRVEHRIGPAQLLLSELLPLPAVGLAARLASEMDRNPALELADPATCAACGHPVWRTHCGTCPTRSPERPAAPTTVPAAPVGPRERLLLDAAATLNGGDRRIAAYLVADVDVYGVLDEPVERVAQRLGVSAGDVGRVIAVLRRAGRPGLCAATVAESLHLQAAEVAGARMPPEVRTLLGAGLDTLVSAVPDGGPDPAPLRRAVDWLRANVTAAVFEECVEPRPPAPVDIVVRRNGRELRIDIVAGSWSALRVADSYRSAAGDPAVRAAVERAEGFVTALGRRDRAVHRVADAVVARQADRVLDGPAAHRRLTRREIAGELGLHESTVSRVVANKKIALPSGETVALAALFGAGADAQHCLREVIGAEQVPLSDSALASALNRRGHRVARRTVAKYRAELGIPDAARRAAAGWRHAATP